MDGAGHPPPFAFERLLATVAEAVDSSSQS
jgi:hypothetical protein